MCDLICSNALLGVFAGEDHTRGSRQLHLGAAERQNSPAPSRLSVPSFASLSLSLRRIRRDKKKVASSFAFLFSRSCTTDCTLTEFSFQLSVTHSRGTFGRGERRRARREDRRAREAGAGEEEEEARRTTAAAAATRKYTRKTARKVDDDVRGQNTHTHTHRTERCRGYRNVRLNHQKEYY